MLLVISGSVAFHQISGPVFSILGFVFGNLACIDNYSATATFQVNSIGLTLLKYNFTMPHANIQH